MSIENYSNSEEAAELRRYRAEWQRLSEEAARIRSVRGSILSPFSAQIDEDFKRITALLGEDDKILDAEIVE